MSESGLEVRTEEGAVVFPVRVAPRASRSAIAGLHGGALKVALTAPPVEGAANAALVKLLAKKLGVAKSAVTIVRGERGRDKQVRVAGVDAAAARALAR
ncbi:MAG TPA: DUF167 family protein [Polyangiaceae bacterium LLY-WYZ-15_(1-7)]|nr:YggU family protein [Myxococcales bacterium]MBJ69929.1 YggU family protein [Sandaracinus sp.]HJK92534.1 DUF167 family protein [Polyangiaceae bacterium LLY-WYZ-15_(1-7)]HJL04691.1 DUF167 family protein [Polyangiaceae bacterium LLY-WYZ-15_(1-7)]HJL13164.1 DUF167 family protein [Polyangiaceae bacterium LLY-WYZ-15_(1-7)]